jgi:hypothetical protein
MLEHTVVMDFFSDHYVVVAVPVPVPRANEVFQARDDETIAVPLFAKGWSTVATTVRTW